MQRYSLEFMLEAVELSQLNDAKLNGPSVRSKCC